MENQKIKEQIFKVLKNRRISRERNIRAHLHIVEYEIKKVITLIDSGVELFPESEAINKIRNHSSYACESYSTIRELDGFIRELRNRQIEEDK